MDAEIPSHMCSLPTEMILAFFTHLSPKDLIKCRRVCIRWNLIVDTLLGRNELWTRYCKMDFPDEYQTARLKARPGVSWFNLYKSLSLWPRITDAREDRDEFASAQSVANEIRSFQILDNGVIGVHTKTSIDFYDIETLAVSKRQSIDGAFSRYSENESVMFILSYTLHFFIIRKVQNCHQEPNKMFYNVKLFTVTDKEVYYVTASDEIYMVQLYNQDGLLTSIFIKQSEDNIMALGSKNNQINILTFSKNIYTVVNNELVFACTIGPESNMLSQLQKYNLLDQMDWRIYIQWMYIFNHTLPDGPFYDLIVIHQYHDIYFVGTKFGVLRIYYAASFDEHFDLFSTEPIKQYNFMERSDCPVLSICPIIGVDVMENVDGHTVLVAMPKKIGVINFSHNFKRCSSLAVVPYDEVCNIEALKIDQSC